MEVENIDHVNLRYPADELETVLTFYRDKLGFEAELLEEDDDGNPVLNRSHFSFRLGDDCIIHMTPTENPEVINRYVDESRTSFDHVSLIIDKPIEEIKRRLVEEDIEIEREFEPDGATGTSPAVFVLDPFGYMIELKENPERKETRNEMIRTLCDDGFSETEVAEVLDINEAVVHRLVNPTAPRPNQKSQ
jgi:catechol 2,3-dioxygenase-like lactoylglutathione lyase family enzyme